MRRKKLEMIKRLAASQVIAIYYIDDFKALEKITENIIECLIDIGGAKAVDLARKWMEPFLENLNKSV